MPDFRITNGIYEVKTKGGFHVGYVWKMPDGRWKARGVEVAGAEKAAQKSIVTRSTRAEAAAALIEKLKDDGMFQLSS